MTRVPGDPGPLGWLRFAFGFRMPEHNVHWVRHELTGPGWRRRTVVRHLVVILPVCAVLVVLLAIFLPAPAWVSVMMVLLILAGSLLTVTAYADDIRAARLRQHGLPVPTDPDLGRPTH
jgi:protein-S-isoprenylcysteine O-methyltransferase Ste14